MKKRKDLSPFSHMEMIFLTAKLDNALVSSTLDKTEKTIHALVALLEKSTDNPCER